jgi:hypothetical protein
LIVGALAWEGKRGDRLAEVAQYDGETLKERCNAGRLTLLGDASELAKLLILLGFLRVRCAQGAIRPT